MTTRPSPKIEQAFYDNLVLVFRDQKIEPGHQVRFTHRFGPTEEHPLGSRRGLDAHPEVMVLENRPGKLGPRNDFWHSDISFGEFPPALSMLYAIEVTEGLADTMFCNMYTACQRRSKSTPLAGVKMHHLMRFSPALAVVPVVHRRDPRCFV